ncbi:MAG: class I SAM-dependent methyltransferase [Bacteroidota bacterium]
MDLSTHYPHLDRFSKDVNILPASLIEAFEVEKAFHLKVLNENDPTVRRKLYRDVYKKVHSIYNKGAAQTEAIGVKDKIIGVFRKELYGKSILDVGCGTGEFLTRLAVCFPTGQLVGIDISTDIIPRSHEKVKFINSDIVEFELEEKFDIVFSDNVMEHIAPADTRSHLESIKKVLKKDGKIIIIMPNRLFGPSDVTRIIDYTYSNKIEAMGTHLNESTYGEMISVLHSLGFRKFHTILPLPKLKFIFPNVRINASFIAGIERNAGVMKFLYSVRYKSKCAIRLDIILVCSE